MATAPLKLADVQIGSALTENWGRPTPYFQRYMQDNNSRITASITGVEGALAELALQQAQLTAQQAQLTTIVSNLTAQQAALANLVYATIGTANTIIDYTDGTGYIRYPHGYSNSTYPPLSQCSIAVPWGISPVYHIQDIAVDATNIIFYCTDMAGSPLLSTPVGFAFHVAGA